MFENYPDVVTVKDVMRMLQLSKSSVYNLLQSNLIQHVKVGRKYVIPKGAVIGFLDSMCYNGNQMVDGRLHSVMKGEFKR